MSNKLQIHSLVLSLSNSTLQCFQSFLHDWCYFFNNKTKRPVRITAMSNFNWNYRQKVKTIKLIILGNATYFW